ncbi:MAG: hypothetical protein IT584_02135 [Chlamydiae bacterium]|nr:hypothetical protein [Chlamydiota bacterium]
MGFFKKKKQSETTPLSERKSFQEIIHERVLTAEGWRRRLLKKAKKVKAS